MSRKCRAFSKSKLGLEPADNRKAFYAGWEAALAQQAEPKGGGNLPPPLQAEPDISRCPQCGGIADNGHDRSIPPNPYFCTKCMAEMPQPSYNVTVVDDAHPNGIPLDQWQNKLVQEPLPLTDLQAALVLTNLIDRDAIDNPDEYDEGSTLAQIDELYRIIRAAAAIRARSKE